MAIGINLLLLLLLLHKHQQHYLVNTTTIYSTRSCSSSTNSSKSSSSTTHSSEQQHHGLLDEQQHNDHLHEFPSSMAQSSSSCSQRSSSVTTCTSCTKTWTKKKKGAASSDSIDTLTRGRSSKQDVYFLHKGRKTLLLPAVAVQLRLKAAATKLSERGLLSRTHPVQISAQINTFHCGSHAKRTQRKTLEKIDNKLWVTSLRAAITQKLQMATHGFLGMVRRCFWLRNSWTRSQRNQTTDWWQNDVRNSSALGCGSMYVKHWRVKVALGHSSENSHV